MSVDERVERAFMAAVKASPAEPMAEEMDSSWQKVMSAIQPQDALRHTHSVYRGYSQWGLRGWFGYSLIACCALGLVTWQALQSNKGSSEKSTYTTYATRSGQRASVTLRDGSRATLGPVTTLRVRRIDNGPTSVEVTGEVLFNVNHFAVRPFIVMTYGVTTRVLGTEFVVRAYSPSHVRVAVRDGRVSVQSQTAANSSIVTAGEGVSITPNTLPQVGPISDLATEFAWANGELVLRNVPLDEAFVRLSRWYGLEFRAASQQLLEARVNATFPSTFSETDIQGLADALSARLVQSGKVLTFRSR